MYTYAHTHAYQCVKALLFHKVKCEVNATNEQGDTPLHNAARWGYGKHPVFLYLGPLDNHEWRPGNEASWGGGLGMRLAGVEAWE